MRTQKASAFCFNLRSFGRGDKVPHLSSLSFSYATFASSQSVALVLQPRGGKFNKFDKIWLIITVLSSKRCPPFLGYDCRLGKINKAIGSENISKMTFGNAWQRKKHPKGR